MRGTGSCATGSHSSNPNAKTPHFRDRAGELLELFRQRQVDAIRSSDPGVEMVAVRLQSAVLLRAPAFASRVWVVHSEEGWLSIGPLELAA